MGDLVKEGVLFDSFSESCDSKEGSLRGGADQKGQGAPGPRLQVCLKEAVAVIAAGASISCAPTTWIEAPAPKHPHRSAACGEVPEVEPPAAGAAATDPPNPGHGGAAKACPSHGLHRPSAEATASCSTPSSYAFSTQGTTAGACWTSFLCPRPR